MNTTKISCGLGTTNPAIPLAMEIWLDNQKIFDQTISQSVTVDCEVDEHLADHEIKFVMKNKESSHTLIDAQGNIISDARLVIKDVKFESIDVTQLFLDKAVYRHDFNGTGTQVEDKFFGEMGCNGQIVLNFSTPVYLWLLENM